jgi:hypothetical protein
MEIGNHSSQPWFVIDVPARPQCYAGLRETQRNTEQPVYWGQGCSQNKSKRDLRWSIGGYQAWCWTGTTTSVPVLVIDMPVPGTLPVATWRKLLSW